MLLFWSVVELCFVSFPFKRYTLSHTWSCSFDLYQHFIHNPRSIRSITHTHMHTHVKSENETICQLSNWSPKMDWMIVCLLLFFYYYCTIQSPNLPNRSIHVSDRGLCIWKIVLKWPTDKWNRKVSKGCERKTVTESYLHIQGMAGGMLRSVWVAHLSDKGWQTSSNIRITDATAPPCMIGWYDTKGRMA